MITYEDLKQPDENLKIYFSPTNLTCLVSPKVKSYDHSTAVRLSQGSFNEIWKKDDKAIRINIDPMNYSDVKQSIQEYLLTLRLSALGIAPRVYDIFVAKLSTKPLYFCIMITDHMEKGSLFNCLQDETLSDTLVKNIARANK